MRQRIVRRICSRAKIALVVATLALGLGSCTGTLSDSAMGPGHGVGTARGALELTLVADETGALVDQDRPDLGTYPNPREVASLTVVLNASGELCASDGANDWCGGPVEGIPYTIRVGTQGGDLCLRVVDVRGNTVDEQCQPVELTEDLEAAEDIESHCRTVELSGGMSCRLCVGDEGRLAGAICAEGDEEEPLADAVAGAEEVTSPIEAAVTEGFELVFEEVNRWLPQMGIDVQIDVPDDPMALVSLEEGEFDLTRSECDEVEDDDTLEEDGRNFLTSDHAIEQCVEDGRCRFAQAVTRAMHAACLNMDGSLKRAFVELGIVTAGFLVISGFCDDDWDDDGYFQHEGDFDEDDQEGVPSFREQVPFDYECRGSPLVMDLANDGLALVGTQAEVRFPLLGNLPLPTGWLAGSDDALLALDLDENGSIDHGRELFGEATHGWSPDGFAALRRYDDNGDGVIDELDQVYSSLLGWVDDGDGQSASNELHPLDLLGVETISLHPKALNETDEFGNLFGLNAPAVTRGGANLPVIDVWFALGQ